MVQRYDVVILGGGAGLKLARPAAHLGHKVAVVEPGPLGGTCLNRGCIPSKMLIHPADIIQQVKEAKSVELNVEGSLKVNASALVQRVNETVDEEAEGIEPLLRDHPNIDYYPTSAQFVDPYTLQVGSEKISGKKTFIAVGARPCIPDIPGLDETPYMTSTELLRLTQLPKEIIIIGAGYIACELGHYLDAMGVNVHFVVRSHFLKQLDVSVQKGFEKAYLKRFPCTKGEPKRVEYKGGEFTLHVNGGQLKADALLVATGVVPNSDQLHLPVTSIQCDSRGYIQVDEHLETTQKNIYAYGDVIGRCMFRHSANFEGEYLFHEHFENPSAPSTINYPYVPYGVFTWPQIAGVGKTEEELKESHTEYYVGINHYKNSAMGMAMQPEVGFVKLLFDKKSLRLLGAHILGEQATTMIHTLIAFINMNATLDDILRTIYIHPALPEVIRNAARKVRQSVQKERTNVD